MNESRRHALLNIVWGVGYIHRENEITGIGLLVARPFLHIPILIIGHVRTEP